MKIPYVISIVGPESSGKTTLAQSLASTIGCRWLPEHARDFLNRLGRSYEFEDVIELAAQQFGIIQQELDNWQKGTGQLDEPTQHFFRENEPFSLSALITNLRPLRDDVLIIDGGMLTIQQWARIKYGKSISTVEEAMERDPTSLYLITRARKEWEFDPLREAPSFIERVWIFNLYMQAVVQLQKPFQSVAVEVSQARTP